MKDYTMFNFEFLFSDHFAKISNEARLYYVKLNFFASRGFVANPISVLDSLGYDKSVYWELVNNEEILTLPGRAEIFITSYYVHNPRFSHKEWWKSPFSVYWKGKLYIKRNGVATFKVQKEINNDEPELLSNVKAPSILEGSKDPKESQEEFEKIIEDITNYEDNSKYGF